MKNIDWCIALGTILCLSPSKHHSSVACTSLLLLFAFLKLALSPLIILSAFCHSYASPFSPLPFFFPLKSLMPVSILLLTLSHPLLFYSDWLLWCSSRVTGLCGPWSSLALTACYLHGDGWLRRCCALLLTTVEDRAHTWDTSPTLLLSLSHHPSAAFLFFFLFLNFCFLSVFCDSGWRSYCGAAL